MCMQGLMEPMIMIWKCREQTVETCPSEVVFIKLRWILMHWNLGRTPQNF